MKDYGFPLLSPFKKHIWQEFDRRKRDFGLEYQQSPQSRQESLRGPRNTWLRFHSNAVVQVGSTTYQGLTMDIGKDFDSTYGTGKIGPVIGYDSQGNALRGQDPNRYRPGPVITGVTVGYGADFGTIKDATINWTCYTIDHLEVLNYFFLNPGITCILEYGWGNVPSYAFDLSDEGVPSEFKDGDRVRKGNGLLGAITDFDIIEEKQRRSGGNYDAVIGQIVDYGWTMAGDTYECFTKIMTTGETYLALRQNERSQTTPRDQKDGPRSFEDYFRDYVDRIRLDEPEDPRIWRHQNLKVVNAKQDDDGDLPKVQPEEQDWVFITWGLLEELLNTFIKTEVQAGSTNVNLFEIDSADIVISYHPNLISTNGDVCVFPFDPAPVYRDGKLLAEKDNLKINGISMGDDMENVYSAKLHNIFVNVEAIQRNLSKEPLRSFLYALLSEISGAGCSLWNFQLRSKANRENVIEVVDLNYTKRPTERFVNVQASDDPNDAPDNDDQVSVYLFRVDKSTGFIKDFSMETNLSGDMVSNIVFSRLSRNNDDSQDADEVFGSKSDVQTDLFMGRSGTTKFIKDRLYSKINPPNTQQNKKTAPDQKTVEEYDPTQMWSIWDEGQKKYKRYAYPHPQVVNSYLYDNDPHNNRNNNLLVDLKVNLTIQGISGIRPGDAFMVDSLPKKYRNKGVFTVVDVAQQLDGSLWDTRIDGQFRIARIR